MDANRRQFTLIAGALASGVATAAGAAPRKAGLSYPRDAWHQRMKRVVQINFNERDPENFDVEAWADYLASAKAQVTFLSGTNVVAFYPTAIKEVPVSRWLNGRDLFGECVAAAKKRGIRVMGRFSIDIAKSALAETHPEWFCRTEDGKLVRRSLVGSTNDPAVSDEFAPTCQFTSYYTDVVPRLFREVITRYPIDGIYSNGWPSPDVVVCYCPVCRKIGDPHSEAYRDAFQKRAVELWKSYTALCAQVRPGLVFTGNLGGGFRGGDLDLAELADNAPWFMADNQGRGNIGSPTWDASQQTRIGRAIMRDRPVSNITASYEIAGDTRWRNVAGNPAEVRSRMFQTMMAGGTVQYHWLGFHQGFVEDRRWQKVGREVLAWAAANEAHFHNKASIVDVALVVSQRSNRLYKAPDGTDALDAAQGMYLLLTEARLPFDVVLERDLTDRALLRRYKALILPNIAVMSDAEVAGVKAYAASGGSVLTTFETGLYDEEGRSRAETPFAGLFGMRRAGPRETYGRGPVGRRPAFAGSPSIQRIERDHPLTRGFTDTNWIQGSSCRAPISADGPPILTHVPPYVWYPPEGVYPTQPKTDIPTVVARERGGAKLVHLSEDIEAGYWRTGANDLGDLVRNAFAWMVPAPSLAIDGEGLIECSAWVTEPGYTVHLVNHTQPAFRANAARAMPTLGAQAVRLTLPDPRPIRRATLLRAGTPIDVRQEGASVRFTVPAVGEYEAVALEV
ncbi:alpha-amylase family protein [Sphingomonas sp.]|uniref:alpha-amylase family protein n=1 Tax=Sphingomonas sp. TaxID=28214 RepID=UPI003B3ACEFA